MIDAAIIGLGRWGQAIVQAVQGKSTQLRFVRGVCKEADGMRGFAARHGLELSEELDDALADPRDVAAVLVEFDRGATGLMATVRAGPAFWRVHVFGTNGWAEARDETTLTVALMGAEPQTRSLPAADSLAGLLDAFAAAVDGGKPFPVSTAEMLDVVGAFEAVIGSIAAGVPVKVARNGRAG